MATIFLYFFVLFFLVGELAGSGAKISDKKFALIFLKLEFVFKFASFILFMVLFGSPDFIKALNRILSWKIIFWNLLLIFLKLKKFIMKTLIKLLGILLILSFTTSCSNKVFYSSSKMSSRKYYLEHKKPPTTRSCIGMDKTCKKR